MKHDRSKKRPAPGIPVQSPAMRTTNNTGYPGILTGLYGTEADLFAR